MNPDPLYEPGDEPTGSAAGGCCLGLVLSALAWIALLAVAWRAWA